MISLENNKVNGILGFIKYSDNKSDIATVMWKSLKNKSRLKLNTLDNFLNSDRFIGVGFLLPSRGIAE